MKVAQEIDVDNTTIIVNEQNQLESQVVIEEVAGLTMPVTLTKDGKEFPVTKVGKLAGTDWLVFQVQEIAPKETIRIPTSVLVKDMSDDTHVWSGEHKHRIAYILTPENNEAFKTGTVSSNAVLTFNMLSSIFRYQTTKDVTLPTNTKGEFELHIDYASSDTTSEIESVIPSGAITVETEDKIYIYELVSPVTVVDYGDVDPTRSFTAEVNCGDYTWTEDVYEGKPYLLGTANQPTTITLSSNDFTADDIQEVNVVTEDFETKEILNLGVERNGMVLNVIDQYYAGMDDVNYLVTSSIEVVLKDGFTLRSDIRLECPITKSA